METNTITVKNIRPLWLTKDGMPKKECLIDVLGVFEKKRIALTGSKGDKYYAKQLCNSVIYAIKKYFRSHNVNWIDTKIGNKVYHGFSKKKEYIENSILRSKKRLRVATISFSNHKKLAETQLELTFRFEDK